MMLTPSPAQAAPLAPNRISDAVIADVARNAGLAGCRGVPAGTWVAVALAESGGNPNAHNTRGEDSRGLWQINMRANAGLVGNRNLYDPATNAWAAKKICERQGVGAWGAYTNGAYRQFLARGNAAAGAAGGGRVSTVGVSNPVSARPGGAVYLSMRTGGRAPAAVKQVQHRLAALGYRISIDGVFGPQTNHAVRDYQRKHGLVPDGVVGPRTAASLFGSV
jgi:hypothetical protein